MSERTAPPAAQVYTVGEAMARISSTQTGPLRHSTLMRLGIAGAEANVAIGLARLGVTSRWLGRVGDDEFGRLITSVLRGEGVATDAIIDEASTGLLIKERRTAGLSRVNYYRADSAGSHIQPSDLDEQAIAEAEVLHLTGITLALGESGAATVHRALDVAREANTLVSFDVNYRKALWPGDVAGAALRAIVPKTDILFAGMGEARLMTDAVHERDIARELAALGPRQVVIKRGPDGAFGLIDGQIVEAPLYRMPELDPVGAGDAFTAGYLAEIVAGADIEQTLQTAAQCGAFSVTVDGDWEGLPTRDDLGMLTAMGEVQR